MDKLDMDMDVSHHEIRALITVLVMKGILKREEIDNVIADLVHIDFCESGIGSDSADAQGENFIQIAKIKAKYGW